MLNSKVESSVLQELKQASSLVEAPNVDKKPDEKKLMQMFKKVKDIKERNSAIVQAYKDGYSQQMIAKVLGISHLPKINASPRHQLIDLFEIDITGIELVAEPFEILLPFRIVWILKDFKHTVISP